MGVVDIDVRVSSYLKKLAWAADDQLWVIYSTKELKGTKNKAF